MGNEVPCNTSVNDIASNNDMDKPTTLDQVSASKAPILLLDEPSNNIDKNNTDQNESDTNYQERESKTMCSSNFKHL